MLTLAANDGRALGIFSVVVLVAGFVAVGALWWFVIRTAPPDGSDIGMLDADIESGSEEDPQGARGAASGTAPDMAWMREKGAPKPK